jgi:hypothetical protein
VNFPSDGAAAASTSRVPVPRRLVVDLLIAAALLIGSGTWATTYWHRFLAKGGDPQFYQNYFEPAVMVACGKGFVVTQGPRPPSLDDFLARRRDTFDCRDLPEHLAVGRKGLFQGAWVYLETMVGWSWSVLGISWNGMGPLFGLLFGASIALAYGIFRLGMGPPLATLCALGLTTSAAHLMNLPNLRDYAKAPFTLASILVIGLLVTRPVTRRSVLLLCAAYGAILGLGYGFRTDFLANLPILPLVLFAFVEGGITKRLALKAAATALCFVTFILVSWPALTTVYGEGGCQWHVALLGLQTPSDDALHVAAAPYDFGYAYSDNYIDWTVRGYAHRVNPAFGDLTFCSHEYDVQSGAYLRQIASGFPADIIARAYGSVLQIAELPFLWWAAPVSGLADGFYEARAAVLRPKIGWGVYIIALALLVAGAASLRLGLFLLLFTLYFGGYPAIQFQTRHHFHLEFMTWWAFGFIVHQAAVALWSLRQGRPDWRLFARGAVRSATFAATAAMLVIGPLAVARWYQRGHAARVFEAYIAAPKQPLTPSAIELKDIPADAWPQYLEVDLNEAACGPHPAVTFRYNVTAVEGDLSRTFTVKQPASAPGLTRVFLPVFPLFKQLEFSDDRPGCVVGSYRVTDVHPFPILLGLMLPPDWRTLPLHQRLRDWESGP